ncbi:MAG: carboxymuconolactone decarboxylase family protein [Caulobacteraceae bacterium]
MRLAIFVLALAATAARAEPRLGPVPPASYDAAQQQAAKDFAAARGQPPFGPFAMLMRSPELMTSARSMGDYLRFHSAIGNTLSEFVILIVSHAWDQEYEWNVHAPIAAQQGIAQAKIDAVAAGRRPGGMSDDEAICYDFTTELQRDHQVSDATYARALKRWGEKGVVDLAGISGYYTFLAVEMNAARSDPGGPLRLPPQKR